MDISRIIEDIKFAEEDSDELPTAADILRYAAALNPEATRKEFVEAARARLSQFSVLRSTAG